MSMDEKLFRPARPTPPEQPGEAVAPLSAPGLALPHERDESKDVAATEPDPVMLQAKHDIDAGLVDTDMHATPGLDAALRRQMVPGPGGKPTTEFISRSASAK